MMATREQIVESVLNRLRGALGTGETPANSNHNFITEWYNDNIAKIGNGPWCEMTNTWAVHTAGFPKIKNGRAYTVWAAQDAQKTIFGSSWHWGTAGMRAGDQVYYDWGKHKGDVKYVDHTGTVEKVLGDGTFYVLEGNTSANKLQRMRRDSTYVVGYARLNYESEAHTPIPPRPVPPPAPSKKKANKTLTKKVQSALEVTADGQWGANTDARAQRMRTAARAKNGYPRNVPAPFNVKDVQLVVDTTPDGSWGPKSSAALVKWIKEFQSALGFTKGDVDGSWGPKTDNAYLATRKQNLNNF